jgi:hypothetical protein
MSTELLQIFFALLIEIILLIIALSYPDKRRQLIILMVMTAIVGGIVFVPCMVSEEMRHGGGKNKVEIPAKI